MEIRVIDVREYPEYAAGHVPGSELVPLGSLEKVCEQWDRSHPLRMVCRSGRRAEKAKQLLDARGFTSVEVLEGGIDGWMQSGNEISAAERRPWAMERQVRVVAGSLVLGFVALGLAVSMKFVIGAGLVGAGLVFAGVSDTCMMASLLGRMPWNRARTTCL